MGQIPWKQREDSVDFQRKSPGKFVLLSEIKVEVVQQVIESQKNLKKPHQACLPQRQFFFSPSKPKSEGKSATRNESRSEEFPM
jgi:hypothetical protein